MQQPGRTIRTLTADAFAAQLGGPGLGIRVGPFDFHLQCRFRSLGPWLHRLYADYPLLEGDRVYSGHVAIRPIRSWRRSFARRIRFTIDGRLPHEDMPDGQELAVLEWGLNLVIALRYYRYLMLHSAVVERGGRALLLPAWPGHGKTTLCVALVHRGWRLLSDEFGLVRPGSTSLVPVPRLMPLKNKSIGVIREFAPESVIGPEIPNTRKGTVAHVRPPTSSIEQARVEAPVRWLVFPRWVAGSPLALEPIAPVEAFMQVATNSFNYELLGVPAFETVRAIVGASASFRLVYSDLGQAVAALTAMADGDDQ